MLAQDKYQAVTNEIEEIQEVRKKVDDMRVKFEKIKEKIENNWSGENKDSYIRGKTITYRVGVYTILFVELFMHPIHNFFV